MKLPSYLRLSRHIINDEGYGLGLPACKDIVESYHGGITFTTEKLEAEGCYNFTGGKLRAWLYRSHRNKWEIAHTQSKL